MPNPSVSPTNSSNSLPKPKSKIKSFFKFLGILFVFVLVYVLAIVFSNLLGRISENIRLSGVNVLFDPLITVAYLAVFFSVSHYYSLTKKQAYLYLLLSLFLSFTINFVEGSFVLVLLAPALRKFKLIEPPTI